MNKMNEMVRVTWIDAQMLDVGCIQQEELPDLKPIDGDVLGFLVHEDKERIVIAREKWKEAGTCKYLLVIPKCSVVKITKLRATRK